MRALLAAVIVMGVLILGSTAALVGLVVHRAGRPHPSALPAPAAMVLDEPAGTRIAAAMSADDRLVLQLSGGGPDRVVVLDLRGGKVLARVGLSH